MNMEFRYTHLVFFFLLPIFMNASDVQEEIRKRLEHSASLNIRANGELVHCKKMITKFYQNCVFEPQWTSEYNISELVQALKNSHKEGLTPEDYHLTAIQKMLSPYKTLSLAEKADLDILSSDAFLLYASHLLSGKLDPLSIDPEWKVSRREGDPLLMLHNALEKKEVLKTLQGAIPQNEKYDGLKKALAQFVNLRQNNGWEKIPEGETLKLNMSDDRIESIRKRLIQGGYLKNKNPENALKYDQEVLNAVRDFQKRNGINADGEFGKETRELFNMSVEQRIDQIKANMERWRWLPQYFGDYFIKVNIADFTLTVVKNGKVEREHKVIVGREQRRTPVFASKVSYLVLNPTWTVPPGILKADILPAVRKNPNYLKGKNISVLDANGKVMDQSAIDWHSKGVHGFTYRQSPGVDNALGAVKFMFPNPYNVYLHDTPSKELFERADRAFSSGCVRVEAPLDLAEYLLQDQSKWTRAYIDKQVASKRTETVPLTQKPDVYILYWTTWLDDHGQVQFRKDVYQRDLALIEKLKEGPPK
ncbi:MAG: L,D-transpeptidase family protein [Flavobacteriales bacterium]|nr:L,D-transpeptidase family protein [Flavobacteriales bacterium]